MPAILERLSHPFKARLSRRIVLWVFISVIVIETILLIPSYIRREKELIVHLKQLTLAKVSVIMQTTPQNASDQQLLEQIKMLQRHAEILGGALYTSDGKAIGFFGERPELPFAEMSNINLVYHKSKKKARYDLVCTSDQLERDYTLILRHDATSVRKELYAFILRIAGLVVIISVFVTAGAWFALGPIVVTPILRLRGDLIKAGNAISEDQETPEFYSASIQRQDELGEVITAFRQMYHQISDAISKRKRAEAALQQSLSQVEDYSQALNSELEKGRQMQANFLPAQLPQKPGWEFAAYFKPARQVAGDFYDIFELSEDSVGIVIADVCDKGVGAALFMALFRSLIRIFSGQTSLDGMVCLYNDAPENEESDLAQDTVTNPLSTNALKAVRLTNNYIAHNHGDLAMFATLFFGVLDTASGMLTYINGGHDPLFIIKSSGAIKENLTPTGPAVGVTLDAKFEMMQTHLEAGEVLFGYTDGVTEARAANDKFFHEKRMLPLLEKTTSTAGELLKRIAAAVQEHTGNAEQFDDITMVAVRRSFQPDK
jgi:serine phosphatase RsbU (regulator of sigma subunit)